MEQNEGRGSCSKLKSFTIVTAEYEPKPEALLSARPRVTATVASFPAVQTTRCPTQWKPPQQESWVTPGLSRCLSLRAHSPVVLLPSVWKYSFHMFIQFSSCRQQEGQISTYPLAMARSGIYLFIHSCVYISYARARPYVRRFNYFLNYISL